MALGCSEYSRRGLLQALPFADLIDWNAIVVRISPSDVPRTAAILQAIPPAHVARRQRLLGALVPFVTIGAFEFHAVLWELVQLACRAGVCRALPRAGVWPVPRPSRAAALTSAPAGARRHICAGLGAEWVAIDRVSRSAAGVRGTGPACAAHSIAGRFDRRGRACSRRAAATGAPAPGGGGGGGGGADRDDRPRVDERTAAIRARGCGRGALRAAGSTQAAMQYNVPRTGRRCSAARGAASA